MCDAQDGLLRMIPLTYCRHDGDIGTDGSSIELDTTLIVRDSFLCCMAELLGGICGYLRKSEARRSRHSLR